MNEGINANINDQTIFSMYMVTPSVIAYILIISVVFKTHDQIKKKISIIWDNFPHFLENWGKLRLGLQFLVKLGFLIAIVSLLFYFIYLFTTSQGGYDSTHSIASGLGYFFTCISILIAFVLFILTLFDSSSINKNANYGKNIKNFFFYIVLAYTTITIYNFSMFKKTFTRTKNGDDEYVTGYGAGGGYIFYILLLQGVYLFLFLFGFNYYSEKYDIFYKIYGNDMASNGVYALLGLFFFYLLIIVFFITAAVVSCAHWSLYYLLTFAIITAISIFAQVYMYARSKLTVDKIPILYLTKSIVLPMITLFTTILFMGINYTEFLSNVILVIISIIFAIALLIVGYLYRSTIANKLPYFSNNSTNLNNQKIIKYGAGVIMIIAVIIVYFYQILETKI